MNYKHTVRVRTDDASCYGLGHVDLELELTSPGQLDQAVLSDAIARAVNETQPKNNFDAANAIAMELQAIGIRTTVVWPERPIFEIRTRYGEAHVIKINGD